MFYAALLALALAASPSTVHVETVDGGFELTMNPVIQPLSQPPAVPIRVVPSTRREWGPIGTQCRGGQCHTVYGWRYVTN